MWFSHPHSFWGLGALRSMLILLICSSYMVTINVLKYVINSLMFLKGQEILTHKPVHRVLYIKKERNPAVAIFLLCSPFPSLSLKSAENSNCGLLIHSMSCGFIFLSFVIAHFIHMRYSRVLKWMYLSKNILFKFDSSFTFVPPEFGRQWDANAI